MAAYIVAEEDPAAAPRSEVSIGIDMGTSTFRAAIWNGGSIHLFPDSEGRNFVPANVFFNKVGVATDDQLWSGSAIFNVKRLIGRMDNDPIVHFAKETSPFLIECLDIGVRPFLGTAGRDGVWRSVEPEEVLAVQFKEVKNIAETWLGRQVRAAVVTVPVCFTRFQLSKVERACAMAGLQIARLMPEPTAVALLHAQIMSQNGENSNGERFALVFNMGAGYTDAAVAVNEGGVCQIQGLAGESFGGEELLHNLIRYLSTEMLPQLGENPNRDKVLQASGRLRFSAQKAMEELSSLDETLVEVNLDDGNIFRRTVTRELFKELNVGIFQRCMELVVGCLRDADVEPGRFSDVITVGGCSNIPAVKTFLQNIFGDTRRDILQHNTGLDPLEAAVRGAALEGAITSGLSDPSLDFLTVQAMPSSVGLGIAGEEFLVILGKNIVIPTSRQVSVTTCHDNQRDALLVVYEGESKLVRENHLLGFFKVSGIPAAGKGVPIISVCFDVDVSNTLRVGAAAFLPRDSNQSPRLREVKMPTLDDGHVWCLEAIFKQHGNNMDVTTVPQEPVSM